MKFKIPQYAKKRARTALEWNKKNPTQKVGITKNEAKILGINSGIERAKQIINNKYLTLEDAKAVRNFYNRFKGCRTKRCNLAIDLWGGRTFGKLLVKELDNLK